MRTWMSLLTSSVSELRRAEIVTISAVCLVPICIPLPSPARCSYRLVIMLIKLVLDAVVLDDDGK